MDAARLHAFGGMVQTADLRSISSQVAPRTSPVRAAVRTVNSIASAPTASRLRTSPMNLATCS